MSAIFISHSSKDKEIASELKTRLEGRKHSSIFLDFDPEKGIVAGQSWERTLYRKLRSCQAVVVICTDNYLSSSWCFAEIALARMERKPIFALKADPLSEKNGLPTILDGEQYIDLRNNPEEGYGRLWRGFEEVGIRGQVERIWKANDPPYPGLLSFKEKDASIFFGREAEIEKALGQLNSGRRQDLFLILGASGSGKSSLLLAGLVPRLRLNPDRWLLVGPLRPAQEPVEELAAALSRTFGGHWQEIVQEIEQTNDLAKLARKYRRGTQYPETTVLLVIDQFEELLGHNEVHPANRFLALLREGLEDDDGALAALATMRSDFLSPFQQHPQVGSMEFDSLSLGPMPIEDIGRIIEEPAKLAQMEIESRLVDRLLRDMKTAEAMPLLAFTLRKLWESEREKGTLTIQGYEALGGIQRAVASEAEAAFEASLRRSKGKEYDLQSAFLKMVRITEEGTYSRRLLQPRNSSVHKLLDQFVKSRLLIVREDGALEVAHETLFHAWNRLASWIEENRAGLVLQQQIRRAASLWQESSYASDDLWRGVRLRQAKELLESGRFPMDEIAERFIAESYRDEEETRKQNELLQGYRLLRESALRKFAARPLGRRIDELEVELKNTIARFHHLSGTGFEDDLQEELNVLRNFLGQGGRWHPSPAYEVSESSEEFKSMFGGDRSFYGTVWRFPCCRKWTFRSMNDAPSQFQADGCQDPPVE